MVLICVLIRVSFMAMADAIRSFPEQFGYDPEIQNKKKLASASRFLVCGMGGSHLGADLVKLAIPAADITVHMDYGLPVLTDTAKAGLLVIASSYSGNTEETFSSYEQARDHGLPLAAIAVGGRLLEMAKADGVPYVQLPDTGIQPRSALGFSMRALLALMGEKKLLSELEVSAQTLDAAKLEADGKALAEALANRIPVIYASERNRAIAYNWKIKFNETGKIPAFMNVIPELNHNEMTGFDVKESVRHLSDKFHFLFLSDQGEDTRVIKRMKIIAKLYRDRGLPVTTMEFTQQDRLRGVLASLILADWTAVALAEYYGLESEQVPMVEEFKKLIAE